MGKKTPLPPALGGGSRRDDTGGQLLRELEALSHVLYNAGQQNGRPPRKESPSSPFLGSLPGPRRSQELQQPHHPPLSPHLAGRPYQAPPSPHLGGSRDSPSEKSSSPYLSSYANQRLRDIRTEDQPRSPQLVARSANGPPSPYLAGLNGPQAEPCSPVIVSQDGTHPLALRRSGNRREGGGKPLVVAPLSPHLDALRGYELPKSPLIVARRSVDSLPSLPPKSPQVSRPQLRGHFRPASESSPTSRSVRSLNITELTLSSAAAALRSPHQRPPAHARAFSPLSQSLDLGKKVETYRLDGGRESAGGEAGAPDSALKPWHSQGFEKNLPEVNFPAWLEDNVQFSKQLEAPKEKRSLWNWGPFKALSHIGAQRFNCMFTVHVHGIEGLPAVTNGLRLAVSWKRKETHAQSMPGRVFQGSVEFEESLYLKSTVYGTKGGSKGLKFEPKCFDLAVVALDVDELVLGKHRLDLSRLLPKTAEARKQESDRSWTTSFKLTGKAKGGTLIVTFGCQLLNKNSEPTTSLASARFTDSPTVKPLRSYSSLPSSPDGAARGPWAPTNAGEFSPAMPEMPIDGEYMKMEHLSLNDDFDNGHGRFSALKSSQKGDARPSFSDTLVSQRKLSYAQQAASSEREDLAKALYEEDDGSEFSVVVQGHEISAIVESVPAMPLEWDDPRAEEDTVEGLSDGEVHEDLLEDSAFLQAQIGVDVSENVKNVVLSEDKSARRERGEVITSQVAEVGGGENLPQVVGGYVNDGSPVAAADPEVRHKGEISVAVENLKNGGKGEEQEQEQAIVEVDGDWSGSVVEDLDVLSRSWSVGIPAGKIEELVISREELLFGDNEDENITPVASVESKGDEKTENVMFVEKDEEEEEETTNAVSVESKDDEEHEKTTNLIVAESNVSEEKSDEIVQSMSTPVPQVQTKVEDVEEDDYDLVTGEFLSFLRGERGLALDNSESGEDVPDSPRALLLQQFEQEALIEGGVELNFHLPEYAKFRVEGAQEKNDASRPPPENQPNPLSLPGNTDNNLDWGNEDDDELAAILEAAEAELEKATQILKSKARAKMLEDEETKALMEEWGLSDTTFAPQSEQEDLSLAIVPVVTAPPLGNGLGPVMHIRDGGSLRSMSPTHFRAGGQLLLQASDPVVVGAKSSEMGVTSVEMLRRMAVAGMEGMAAQAMMAMPLEDLTGMALDQTPVEQRPAGFTQPLGSRSQNGYAAVGYGENNSALILRDNGNPRFNKRNGAIEGNPNDEHLGLEDLAPMAMLKIEALALEGLKIQADMADQDAPYCVEPLADEENHRRTSQGGIPSLKRGNSARHCRAGEGDLMSLNEWICLDAGVGDEDAGEDQTAAHNKTKPEEKSRGRRQSASRGVMGDTVTLSMLVQLRDPFRSNEPVGAPMMALVQAERVRASPKPTLGHRSSRRGSDNHENGESAESPKFKIVDITIAGLAPTDSNSPSRNKLDIWNKPKQLAAGSRWLTAHGMAKPSKSSTRTKPAPDAEAQGGDSLWSISARVHGSGAKWRDSHIRNPTVIFTDSSIRTY